YLRINRPKIGMTCHENFFTGARNHRPCRHGDLGNNCSNLITEHLVQVIDEGFGCRYIAAGRVQDEVQAVIPLTAPDGMDAHHEPVFVLVVNFGSNLWLREKPGVICDYASSGFIAQSLKVFAPDGVERALCRLCMSLDLPAVLSNRGLNLA